MANPEHEPGDATLASAATYRGQMAACCWAP
ncbi:uncharacterized protein METZ01_LOCUS298205 [marine metagenome]|uniref:Uncharacterized protein n=1 Tax=marine metagenome TaxID=408172 RepID=A0A382MDP3_9ZZZZ